MRLKAALTKIKNDFRNFGLLATCRIVFMESINRVITFRVVFCMKLETVNPKFLESEVPLEWGFIPEDKLYQLAQDPNNKLSEDLVREALGRGDECYGALDGDMLAACGWYSTKPTEDYGLMVYFDPAYVYMYAGVTHPKFRGKRLHGIGMNRALREYQQRGYKAMISYAEAHNYASLSSALRLGYVEVGYVRVIKIGKLAWIKADRGCREHGFYLTVKKDTPLVQEPALAAH